MASKRCPLAHMALYACPVDTDASTDCIESACAWWSGERCGVLGPAPTSGIHYDFRGEANPEIAQALARALGAQVAIDEFQALPFYKRLWYWLVSL